jgi:N-acetylglutamate synthase
VPAPGPAHGLGPHVVGKRVVVRRLVPGETGPSGGPAMTDVLGICLSWDGTTCVVAPETGPPVAIPLDLIVTGKPVPTRASIRQRVSAREAERHSLPLWPLVERVPLGEWELRTDQAPVGRLLKRANSCLAFGDPGMPLPAAAEAVRDFYASRGRDPMAQVEIGSAVDAALAGLGWAPVAGGDAHFLLTSLAHASRLAGSDLDVEVEEDGPRARVVRRVDGREVGAGRAAIDGDWLGVHGLVVEPDHRGQGHATAMMAALLEWGAERGATTVWLHVETGNAPALSLYEALDFRIHHTNRYLSPPGT